MRNRITGRKIDLKRWNRREHFLLFRKYDKPFFSATVDVDVTMLWNRSHQPRGPSFFLSSLYLMLKSANETEPFRLRLRNKGVWIHDRVAVGTPIQRPDGSYAFARVEFSGRADQFASDGERAIAESRTRKAIALPNEGDDDIVYQSTLPWLRFTAFANALPRGNDSIPRIAFGKCADIGGRITMPVAIEVHHAVVDGADVAAFVERFQSALGREGTP